MKTIFLNETKITINNLIVKIANIKNKISEHFRDFPWRKII